MLKHAVALALLLFGFAVLAPAAVAAPFNDDTPLQPYNSESPARIRQEMDRRAPDAGAPAQGGTALPSAPSAGEAAARECADCPPPKHYDNVEVVKTSRDVDQSRVINSETVVHAPPRVKEINKLVIHENETRNVGVIQHNRRIVEKEIRYVKRAPVYRYQAPAYRVVQRVQTVLVPIVVQPSPPCGCPCTCSGSGHAYGQAYAYGNSYGYAPGRVVVQQVLVPVDPYAAYGYR